MTSRAELHEIVDRLPEGDLAIAQHMLRSLPDHQVVRALLLAPEDDEPVTEEDLKAMREARESLARHGGITTSELRQRLGL